MNKTAKKIGDEPIVLVGMMGAGKTSLGKSLARALRLSFCDSDSAIEEAAHMPIAEIFETHGEAYFRDGERRVIARLLKEPPQILALGGGAFVDDKTRALVNKNALSVWLDPPIEALLARVQKYPQKRPLLMKGDIKETLTKLSQARRPYYEQAQLAVPLNTQSLEKSAAQTLQAIKDYYK